MATTTKKLPASNVVVGSDGVGAGPGGTAVPAGAVHAVAGWQPLCGADRVRFVFPGRDPKTAQSSCPECAAALAPARRARRAS